MNASATVENLPRANQAAIRHLLERVITRTKAHTDDEELQDAVNDLVAELGLELWPDE